MDKKLEYREWIFSVLKSIEMGVNGNHGGKTQKGGWAEMLYPYYTELFKEQSKRSETSEPDIDGIKHEIANRYNDHDKPVIYRILDAFQKQAEAVIGTPITSLLQFFNPNVVEEIPVFLSDRWYKKTKRAPLKKFYVCLCEMTGLSQVFDPIAARAILCFASGFKKTDPKFAHSKPSYLRTEHLLLDNCLLFRQTCGKSTRTFSYCVQTALKWFAREKELLSFTDVSVREITAEEVNRYAQHLKQLVRQGKLGRETANNYWNNFKTFVDFARSRRETNLELVSFLYNSWRVQNTKPSGVDILSDEEVKKLLEEIVRTSNYPLRDYLFFVILIDAGMRSSEALGLYVDEVSYVEENKVFILNVTGKGNEPRSVILSPSASIVLKIYLLASNPSPGEKLFSNPKGLEASYQILYRKFKRILGARKKGGLHRIKHTFVTKALESGAHPKMVMRKTGNKSYKIFKRHYIHHSRRFLQDEINKLPDYLDDGREK